MLYAALLKIVLANVDMGWTTKRQHRPLPQASMDGLNLMCNRFHSTHATLAGRGESGQFRAKKAAAYPSGLCEVLARGCINVRVVTDMPAESEEIAHEYDGPESVSFESQVVDGMVL